MLDDSRAAANFVCHSHLRRHPKHSTKPTSTSSQHIALILLPQHCPPLTPRAAPGAAGPSQAALLPVSTETSHCQAPRSTPPANHPFHRKLTAPDGSTIVPGPNTAATKPHHLRAYTRQQPAPGRALPGKQRPRPPRGSPALDVLQLQRSARRLTPHHRGCTPALQPASRHRKARRQLQGPSAVI